MACNGYFSAGAWTWTEFPNWFNGPNGTSYHDPAVANDGAGLSQSVFVQSDRVFAKNGFGSCQAITPPPTGRGGFLPRVAWSKGADAQHSGPLAVWWYGTDICWAFRNGSGVWNDPPAVALPGSDLNPDVAATSGSHTMPVHAAAPGTQVPAKTWEDYAAPYRNLSIANPRNPYDFVGIVHNAGLDYLRESLAPPVKEGDDTLVGSLRSFFEMKLREDKADTTDYRPAIENLRKDGISTGSFEEELAALTRNPRLRDTVRFNPLMYLRMVDKMCASYATREMDYEGLQGQLRKLEEEVIGDPGESGFGKELVLGGLAIAKYSFQYLDANGIGAERESLQASVGGADRKGWMKGENNTGFLEAVGRATAASAKELWHKAKEWLTQ